MTNGMNRPVMGSRFARRLLGLVSMAVIAAGCATPQQHEVRDVNDVQEVIAPDVTQIAAPEPTEDVAITTAAERKLLAAATQEDLYVRVRLTAPQLPTAQRAPVSLVLAVDTSSSMDGEPIVRAREACLALLSLLSDGDQLALVSYGSRAEVLFALTPLTPDTRKQAEVAIRELAARGTTNMSEGLQYALSQAQNRYLSAGINRVVLLGDGVPNDPATLAGVVNQAASSGLNVTTLGVGAEFDETLMNDIAQRTGGTFHFIEDPKAIASSFRDQALRMQRAVATGATLELRPGPGVVIHEVVGLPTSRSGKSATVQLGELSEGQSRDVLVRVEVAPHADAQTIELLDVRMRYADATTGVAREVDDFLALRASADKAEVAASSDAEIEHTAIRTRVAALIVAAIAKARAGDAKSGQELCIEAQQLATAGAKRFDDDELREKATEARELLPTLAKLAAAARAAAQPPPQPHVPVKGPGHPPIPTSPTPTPTLAPALPPGQAMDLRRSHGSAMKAINGF